MHTSYRYSPRDLVRFLLKNGFKVYSKKPRAKMRGHIFYALNRRSSVENVVGFKVF